MSVSGPNVLLIILDSTRARDTGLSGYHRATTPFLDAFAAEATLYTQARAPAARSLPSHASIFTGHPPQEHEIHDLDRRVAPGQTVWSTLRDRGYATALFTDNPYVADLDTGLSDGFDVIENARDPYESGLSPAAFVEENGLDYRRFLGAAVRGDAPVASLLNAVVWAAKWRGIGGRSVFSSGDVYVDRFASWRTTVDGPWAACLNLMDTHVPFRPAQEYDRWQTDESRKTRRRSDMDDVDETETWKHLLELNAYDGTIRQADAAVERVVDSLRETDALEDTLVVVTSDHGEGFGERSLFHDAPVLGHGGTVDEAVLHVPLVVRRPGQSAGRTVDEPVTLAEFPDLVDRALDTGPARFGSRDVIAEARIDGERVDVLYDPAETGVRKHVVADSAAYVEAVPTPTTSYRTAESVPNRVRDQLDRLSDAGVGVDHDVAVEEDVQRRLAALGYTE